jgi:peptidoglycan/LPS O-acetylase OafA/YrhL
MGYDSRAVMSLTELGEFVDASIAERLDVRDNALNSIRLVLAALVIVSHAAPITGLAEELKLGDLTLGHVAVGGFFAISGFLITQSRLRSRFWPYTWRRALRILPGYWVCLAFTAFGAALFAGAVRGGWDIRSASGFLFSNARMFGGGFEDIGQTLAGLPFPTAWNGSLWTLRYETACYAVVGIFGLVGFVRGSKVVPLAVFAISTAFSIVVTVRGIGGVPADIALLVPFFAAGAALCALQNLVPLNRYGAAAALVLAGASFATGTAGAFSALPLAYLLLWLGVSAPAPIRRIGSKNDYSYGTYLYAFPIQQLLVIAGAAQLGLVAFTIASVLATAPFAFLSWHAVEKPAQRLKRLVELKRNSGNGGGEPQSRSEGRGQRPRDAILRGPRGDI